MSTFAITCEVPPSVFARAITDAVLVQYSKRSLALPVLAFRRSRSFECRFAKLYVAGCSPYGGQLRGHSRLGHGRGRTCLLRGPVTLRCFELGVALLS